MSSSDKYRSRLELRIDWSEMDLYGHINNVSYFKYVQAGRVNLWEETGLIHLYTEHKLGPILASTNLNFKQPLHYPGSIIVITEVESVGNTSFTLVHQILNEKNEIAAEARDIVVMFDFKKNEKIVVPEEFRKFAEKG